MGYNDDWESLMNSVFGAGGRLHTSGDAARQAIEDSRQLLRQMESDGLLAKGAADAAETGKAGSFEGLAAEVKQSVLGQDDYVDALVRAMRRPFVLGYAPKPTFDRKQRSAGAKYQWIFDHINDPIINRRYAV